MRIIHRFSFAAKDSESQTELASLGVRLKKQPLITTFEVDESDPRWPAVQEWSGRSGRLGISRTEFTRAEIAAAAWLALLASWHHGYPQPGEDHFGYRDVTYDLSEWCPACGIGMRQVAPFQMTGEPGWGRNSILQLNWVFDEFFVTPQLWQSVFEPCGVGMLPVLGSRGQELSTVVQLVADELVPVVTDGLPAERCGSCGRLKYLPVTRGFFPALGDEPSASIAKTEQYFGSGGSAFRQVLVNSSIARGLRAAKAGGATLTPLADAP
jgi:hypothetical protein